MAQAIIWRNGVAGGTAAALASAGCAEGDATAPIRNASVLIYVVGIGMRRRHGAPGAVIHDLVPARLAATEML